MERTVAVPRMTYSFFEESRMEWTGYLILRIAKLYFMSNSNFVIQCLE